MDCIEPLPEAVPSPWLAVIPFAAAALLAWMPLPAWQQTGSAVPTVQQPVAMALASPEELHVAPIPARPALAERPSAATALAVLLSEPAATEPAAAPTTRRMRVLVKAYTPYDPIDRSSGWQGVTSTGVDVDAFPGHWGIAADPRLFPYGTRIRIPGYEPSRWYQQDHFWSVDDTGGFCRRAWRDRGVAQIEVRFRTAGAARRWGERWLEVEIIDPPARSR